MLVSSAKQIEIILRSLKPLLAQEFAVDKIGYFGSFARNEQNTDSDVDILVSLNKPLGWEFFDLQLLLEKALGRKVDLVSDKALKTQLKALILKSVKYV